jgi:glycerol-3-phosphate dehydrogenase
MAAGPVDLLVIGGGITGCGVARDAALHGLSVALVERDDFGCGTSSRSSKLVHGGLRYMLYGDFAMVRESAREREVLGRIAPHLVHPLPFLLPVRQDESLLKYQIGLWLFDRFAGIEPEARCRVLTAAQVAERLPGLRGPLKGGLLYREYLTDDARFTLENALSAAEHGALVANHAPVLELTRAGSRVTGAVVRDDLTGETQQVRARLTVNATGPWAAQTMELGGIKAPKALLPSKGIHLIFRAERLPIEGAVVLNAPSGKSGFAIRRWGLVYVGTTDVAYHGSMDHVTANSEAVADLLGLVRECFPDYAITGDDVVGTWAGLRPLIAEPGKSPRDTSRHDEVWTGPEGLLTIAGGKLTTYRSMARRVMRLVEQALGLPPGDPRLTAEAPLPGARTAHPPELMARLPTPVAERLTWLYGAQLDDLIALGGADPAWLEPLAPGVPALRGEVRLAVEREMAATLPDFLDRRAALLLFSPDHGVAAADEASRIMAALLGWSEGERLRQRQEYEQLAAAHGRQP